jgi:hypothetical protein
MAGADSDAPVNKIVEYSVSRGSQRCFSFRSGSVAHMDRSTNPTCDMPVGDGAGGREHARRVLASLVHVQLGST